ncbi:uncharacterized protein Z519_12504 [Cladophialophora bantiana CBS 173.52]|uniref:Zn(2)-C6 fungal-type domain-containing protein n=1 Tax=Cladophialophora bantiana (strain ATCC 10958 / CBS 173.52 / CDC B-1940 / NIH 8579) TaxID=1442370 RepID=A0A0D2H0S3_CLAB1|nr:uncharacterized protein Z519_12504 [Cladophialophora bantiana CBS 173.52]KIW86883.1 hypothetical protein Z519_12504 [Cladophialophora bantiana CBS 173.52]
MSATAKPPALPDPDDTPGLRAHQACRHCVQIEAKCVPVEGSSNSICVRCHPLGKPCTTPALLPRKRRNNGKLTRVSQLEEKINTLTDLLRLNSGGLSANARADLVSAQTGCAQYSQPSPTVVPESVAGLPNGLWSASLLVLPTSMTVPGESNDNDPIQRESVVGESTFCSRSSKTEEPAGSNTRGHFRVSLAPVLEEKLLSDFGTQMNIQFPFVVIPPKATAAALREEKPFLFWTCITAAAQADPSLLRQMADDLMRYIGDRRLMKGEKSIDLLLGLLVFSTWYQCYNQNNPKPAVLAPIGIVVDAAQMFHGRLVNQGIQTSDDRRAHLGVYNLSGQLSSCLRKSDPMRWTQYLEDCCNALTDAAEYPSDTYAVQLVRLHRVIEIYSSSLSLMATSTVPIRSFMTCFKRDLQQYQRSLPPSIAENKLLEMQIQSAYSQSRRT